MSIIARKFIGRFGNQMFMYAFAKAYAELHGAQLQTEPWVGQSLFQINDPPISSPMPQVNDADLKHEVNVEITGYSQHTANYTAADLKRWFRLHPAVEMMLRAHIAPENCSHRRVGDYKSAPYPIISEKSYRDAWAQYGHPEMRFVTEEHPRIIDGLPAFLPDFYRLMTAPVMFRGNSSFSWWAGALSDGRVYSPKVEGLTYNVEHDGVQFIEGNWARICDLHMVGELCLAKK